MVFAEVLREGCRDGTLCFEDADLTAHTLLLATNALLPFSLSARELGEREVVEARVTRLADLAVAGLRTGRNADHGMKL